jgi:hypothetical protein
MVALKGQISVTILFHSFHFCTPRSLFVRSPLGATDCTKNLMALALLYSLPKKFLFSYNLIFTTSGWQAACKNMQARHSAHAAL